MNTQTAQHTPTPWKVWPEHTTGITTHRTDATTCCVARALECKDAAFIVRAVNAHEQMLTALRIIEEYATSKRMTDDLIAEIARVATEARTKAEGR